MMLMAVYMQIFHVFPVLYFDEFLNKLLLHRQFSPFSRQFVSIVFVYVLITSVCFPQKKSNLLQQVAKQGH